MNMQTLQKTVDSIDLLAKKWFKDRPDLQAVYEECCNLKLEEEENEKK